MKARPRYPQIIAPWSTFVPTFNKVKKCIKVENSAKSIRINADKNFPITNSKLVNGSVDIVSIVLILFSLDINPIETAGTKNKYTRGTISNNALRSDWPNKKKGISKKITVDQSKDDQKYIGHGAIKKALKQEENF